MWKMVIITRNKEMKIIQNFLFISALAGTVPTTSDTWLIESGASKHMIGYKDNLSEVVEKESHLRVVLGDDANYTVKGFRSTSL